MTHEIEYTNDIGQTLRPGDEVIIVTTGYSHSVSTNKGVYLGVHENGGVQCSKKVKTRFYVFTDTSERVPSSFWQELNDRRNAWAKNYCETTGKYDYYSQPEYKAIQSEAMAKVKIKYEFVDRRTTLQRNRVYKLAA